jgi:hypothetical protein
VNKKTTIVLDEADFLTKKDSALPSPFSRSQSLRCPMLAKN